MHLVAGEDIHCVAVGRRVGAQIQRRIDQTLQAEADLASLSGQRRDDRREIAARTLAGNGDQVWIAPDAAGVAGKP